MTWMLIHRIKSWYLTLWISKHKKNMMQRPIFSTGRLLVCWDLTYDISNSHGAFCQSFAMPCFILYLICFNIHSLYMLPSCTGKKGYSTWSHTEMVNINMYWKGKHFSFVLFLRWWLLTTLTSMIHNSSSVKGWTYQILHHMQLKYITYHILFT